MTKDKIKDQLISYFHDFRAKSGTFQSAVVIFDYIHFLKTEPYIKDLLSPVFAYSIQQIEMVKASADDREKADIIDNTCFDLQDPSSFPDMPIFADEFKSYQSAIANKENVAFTSGLAIYITMLVLIADSMQEIKDCQKSGDMERANKLIKDIKDEAYSVVALDNIKNFKPTAMVSSQFTAIAIEIINKYIFDKIDSQAFLDGSKPAPALSFDKSTSQLYIRGQVIKIARKSDLPFDHFILEAIFDQDFTDEVYFKDIAEQYLKMTDYDKSKDWQKFRHACDRLNEKVDKATGGNIKEFVQYSTGETGWCKINKKYL